MTLALDIAAAAALVGDPARACMLAELMGDRALPAGELARCAGVAAATASEHLAKLSEAGLIVCSPQGRWRYYRLASAEVAALLETIVALAPSPAHRRRATPRIAPELRRARTCYDHIAGRLGVGVADALIAAGAVRLAEDGGEVTPAGDRLLAAWGVAPDRGPRGARYCRACLDWTERRPHLAGRVGRLILEHSLALGWAARAPHGRALTISERGRSGFRAVFGLEI